MKNIVSVGGKAPRIAEGVFVAPNAFVIGDVEIGEGSSVWFGCVLRGDIGPIRIGKRTNIQDLSCIHLTDGISQTVIGDDVTVGHGVILHGCIVKDRALIGMGSTILDNAVIGEESVVAAGSLVTPRVVIPPGSMVRGSPAKVLREASEEERALGLEGARHYVANAQRFARIDFGGT
ncbi:MAG: gamma carbonic anhydrase family protein [Myxococcales bacterium]|nr:gamma carbonic anhydrase family protein [Myxococcales bacterium]